MSKDVVIDIVIVTYNRLDQLKHTLTCYDRQIGKFRNLIIVDNHSTDHTQEYLKSWKCVPTEYGKFVLTMKKNLGGAGGFYEGQKFAVSLKPDWVLLADDDAYPALDLTKNFYDFVNENKNNLKNVAALCTSVYNPDGEICLSHRCRLDLQFGIRFKMEAIQEDCYKRKFFNVDFFTYVGAIIKVDTLQSVGYDIPQYFIYYDDSEHSIRIRKSGCILCVPQLKMVHDGETKSDIKEIASWRSYYGTRNRIHMLKLHYPISALYFTCSRLYNAFTNREYNWQCRKMVFIAIRDAWLNQLGKHILYRPGWQVTKKR